MRRPIRDQALLQARLEHLVATFDESTISPDPLELVRRYDASLDRETAGIIAAAFAYGRAALIVRNIGVVLDRMEPSPYHYLKAEFRPDEAVVRFRGFVHRLHKVDDLVALLHRLSETIRAHGSLGSLFRMVYRDDDRDVGPALSRFVAAIIGAVDDPPVSMDYLLSSPSRGSACKRMNLFLRWMVRTGEPDLGLWTFVDPAKLLIPVDTHVHRIATFLGLNERKSADWKTARSITDNLKAIDENDPVRFDFAICRLGILDLCSRRRKKTLCDACLLNDVCRLRLQGDSPDQRIGS